MFSGNIRLPIKTLTTYKSQGAINPGGNYTNVKLDNVLPLKTPGGCE